MIEASPGNIYSSSKLQNSISVGFIPSAEGQQRPAEMRNQNFFGNQCVGSVQEERVLL